MERIKTQMESEVLPITLETLPQLVHAAYRDGDPVQTLEQLLAPYVISKEACELLTKQLVTWGTNVESPHPAAKVLRDLQEMREAKCLFLYASTSVTHLWRCKQTTPVVLMSDQSFISAYERPNRPQAYVWCNMESNFQSLETKRHERCHARQLTATLERHTRIGKLLDVHVNLISTSSPSPSATAVGGGGGGGRRAGEGNGHNIHLVHNENGNDELQVCDRRTRVAHNLVLIVTEGRMMRVRLCVLLHSALRTHWVCPAFVH